MIPVSICLVAYNRAAIIHRTLDSLLAQSFGDFELIISDDCSTDGTEEVCRRYERMDKRVKYFRNERNLGMPGNLNSCLSRASGNYIADLHDGDIYHPDLLLKWKKALDETPDAAFVFNAYVHLLADGTRIFRRDYQSGVVDGNAIALHFFRTFSSQVWGTVMARASAYRLAGPFDPSFGAIADVDMWLRLAHNRRVAYVPEYLMELIPNESHHNFEFSGGRYLFWILAIFCSHWPRYASQPGFEDFARAYPAMRRKRFLRAVPTLLRRRRLHLARERISTWIDSDDALLQVIGKIFGSRSCQPDWYQPDWWSRIQLQPAPGWNAPGGGSTAHPLTASGHIADRATNLGQERKA